MALSCYRHAPRRVWSECAHRNCQTRETHRLDKSIELIYTTASQEQKHCQAASRHHLLRNAPSGQSLESRPPALCRPVVHELKSRCSRAHTSRRKCEGVVPLFFVMAVCIYPCVYAWFLVIRTQISFSQRERRTPSAGCLSAAVLADVSVSR